MISDGKKLPRWTPRSTRTVNPRFSDKHASSVPLVLNPQTGYITQFHIVFDDWFATVPASADDLPNFNDDCWQRMFRDSTFQYVLDDEDEERLIVGSSSRSTSAVNSVAASKGANRDATTSRCASSPATPLLTPRRLRNRLRLRHNSRLQLRSNSSHRRRLNSSYKRKRQESERATSRSKGNKAKSTPVKHEPRRSTRNRSAPVRLGYDGQQGHGYMAEFDGTSLEWLYNEVAECLSPPPSSYKASVSDPDTLSFNEAMADHDNIEKWLKAANDEIQSLQKNGTWIEVPITEAKTRILPGTWVFRRKRTPDGTITPLSDPVWIHLPRGFHSPRGHATCLRLLKSLYGLSVAPRLWYQHLSEALREEGFKACANDPCLLYKDTMVVLYVDDLGIAYRDQNDLDKLFANLEAKGLTLLARARLLTRHQFYSRRYEWHADVDPEGLIQKIKEATGMSDSNYNWTPAAQAALGIDPDGSHDGEAWSYRSIVGMLSTCPQTLAPTSLSPSARSPGFATVRNEATRPPSKLSFDICIARATWA
ncbi:hypothetical protein MHU86_19253 [Fragilaria crotonensis]|nr:hypothetical protein MHU86_19253 [Fragilaria crotonensis]